jgi:ribosomal protein S18 acetylase RimI-like enzyme
LRLDTAARADESYFQAWRAFGRRGAGAVRESGGLLCVSSGLPVAFLNLAFVTRPLAVPEDQIASAMAFFDSRREPFVVRIREGLDPASEAACERLGMPYSDTVPGMASANMTAPAPPAGLAIRPVEDVAAIRDFHAVVSAGYEIPQEMVEAFVTPLLLRDPEVECYVGYADGRPAASSTLVFGGRAAGIHNVATAPEFRKRGFGEAMTWHCIERGAAYGCDMAALQSSEMGQSIYARMGFRVVSPYRTFHRPGV